MKLKNKPGNWKTKLSSSRKQKERKQTPPEYCNTQNFQITESKKKEKTQTEKDKISSNEI